MRIIVNLSSLHTLYPINTSVKAFTELCNRYSPDWQITRYAKNLDYCLCNMGFFGATAKWVEPTLNWGWVVGNNLANHYLGKAIIDSYKLGKINTKQFLEELLNVFYFMKDTNIRFKQEDIDRVWSQRQYLISLQGLINKESLTHQHIATALLEDAWNTMVDYKSEDEDKLNQLIQQMQSDRNEIYIISNTNELQVSKIIYLLRQHHPQIKWKEKIDISSVSSDQPVEIAPSIYLYLSYRVGAYKTSQDNKAASNNSTPALLRSLIDKLKCDKSEIRVISQFTKDLTEAKGMGIQNIYQAKDYYQMYEKKHLKMH